MKLVLLSLILLLMPGALRQAQSPGLRVFRESESGFRVAYPADWTVKSPYDRAPAVRAKGNSIVVFQSPIAWDDDQMNFASISICSRLIDGAWDDYAKDYCRPDDSHLSNLYKDEVMARRQITVGGIMAERIETKGKREGFYFYYVSFTSGGREFFIAGGFRKHEKAVFDTFKYEPAFDQVVRSFQFIAQ